MLTEAQYHFNGHLSRCDIFGCRFSRKLHSAMEFARRGLAD